MFAYRARECERHSEAQKRGEVEKLLSCRERAREEREGRLA